MNVSFGRLYIGTEDNQVKQDTIEALKNIVGSNKEAAKAFGNFVKQVDKETGEDKFILTAKSNKTDNVTKVKLTAYLPREARAKRSGNKYATEDAIQILFELTDTFSKNSAEFFKELTSKFNASKESGKYTLYSIMKKYDYDNPNASVKVKNTPRSFECAMDSIGQSKECLKEFEAMLEDISNNAQEKTFTISFRNEDINCTTMRIKSKALTGQEVAATFCSKDNPKDTLEILKSARQRTLEAIKTEKKGAKKPARPSAIDNFDFSKYELK